ncbi:MAG: phosphatase PAP2 family protein [Bacteroidetes bacterium]|nr:phosphatase PAP2 family protein [Bacteroidota bacterium]
MRPFLFLALLPLCGDAAAQSGGQRGDTAVYRLDPWVDVPLCAVGATALYAGLHAQSERTPLTMAMLAGAETEDIPAFDRAALRIDPNGQALALAASDRLLYGTAAAPFVLIGLDPRIRREWGSVATMYVEAATMVGGLQSWTCLAAGRYRPITYIESATLEQRTNAANTHSFFSGHTANTAVASFFMAKVLDDMHPELRGKRWLLYGAAAIPPALVGYYRVEGGKHFPSDVLTGALIGAAAGVLVPELHRTRLGRGLAFTPITSPDLMGLRASLTW